MKFLKKLLKAFIALSGIIILLGCFCLHQDKAGVLIFLVSFPVLGYLVLLAEMANLK